MKDDDSKNDSRARVGDTLPLLMKAQEVRVALGFSYSKFWKLQKAGLLDALKAPFRGYYSGVKVQKFLEGKPLEEPPPAPRRSFGRGSRGGGG